MVLKKIDQLLAQIIIGFIKIYQKTISPDHAPHKKNIPFWGCRFYPSCSVYGIEVLQKYGFAKGIIKISWRILRCNPWNRGGIDKS